MTDQQSILRTGTSQKETLGLAEFVNRRCPGTASEDETFQLNVSSGSRSNVLG